MFLFVILLGFTTFANGALTVEPRHLIVVVGRTAVLSCTHSGQPMAWRRRRINYFHPSNRFSADGRPRIVEAVGGRLDVVVEAVRWDDAGEYQCLSGSKVVSAHLVVLEQVPNCTTAVLGDLDLDAERHLLVRCTLNWTANFDPEMSWFDPAVDEFLQTHLFAAAVGQIPLQQHLLTARPRTSANDHQTQPFEFSLAANHPEPGYLFNWSSVNLNVNLMSVRNVRLRPSDKYSNCCSLNNENVLRVGDELICEADGRPSVKYSWKVVPPHPHMRPPYSSNERLPMYTAGKYEVRCTAIHSIDGVEYNASTQITVHVGSSSVANFQDHTEPVVAASSEGEFSGGPIVVVILVVVVVVAGGVVVMAVFLARRCRDKRQRVTEAAAPDTLGGPTPEREHPVPDAHRRRSVPLPTVNESYVSNQDYDEVDDRQSDDPETQDNPANELPTIDEAPASSPIAPVVETLRLHSEMEGDPTPKPVFVRPTTQAHLINVLPTIDEAADSSPVTPVLRLHSETAPKSVYDTLIPLDLRSSEYEGDDSLTSKAAPIYLKILDSRDTSVVELC